MTRQITCYMTGGRGEVACNGVLYKEGGHHLYPGEPMFWVFLTAYLFLTIFAGLMSGLTMGLLSMDKTQLEILQKVGKPKERKYAKRLVPIVKRHHYILVTLLLSNAGAVEAMPIFMDRITNPVLAVAISVTAVLLFGEIIPQALCTRYGLAIGYYLSPLVYFLMFTLFVLAWPISKLLDVVLGTSHATFFRRAELKELVDMHHKVLDEENEEPLSFDEALIIKGALDLNDKCAKDALVPLDSVYMVESTEKLSLKTMTNIINSGHSRIPVYHGNRSNVVGFLLVKTLITLDPQQDIPVADVMRRSLHKFYDNEPLYNILNECQGGRCHMCIVNKRNDDPEGEDIVLGIITLEDIIEEILQEEIIDETDKYIDVAKRIKVMRIANRKMSFRNSMTASLRALTESVKKKHSMNLQLSFNNSNRYGALQESFRHDKSVSTQQNSYRLDNHVNTLQESLSLENPSDASHQLDIATDASQHSFGLDNSSNTLDNQTKSYDYFKSADENAPLIQREQKGQSLRWYYGLYDRFLSTRFDQQVLS